MINVKDYKLLKANIYYTVNGEKKSYYRQYVGTPNDILRILENLVRNNESVEVVGIDSVKGV